MGEVGGWHLVRRRQRNVKEFKERMDIAGTVNARQEETISFYFSEFPETHSARDMLKAFALYGRVVEVVIPPRRNKWGRRFGFARFADVHDPRLFAVKLDNIIFGAKKIHANLPRFEREKFDEKMKKNVEKPKRFEERIQREVKPKSHVDVNHQQRNQKVWRMVTHGGKKDDAIKPNAEGDVEGSKGVHKDGRADENRKRRHDWKGRKNYKNSEQKAVYYRKKNLCDVWYNAPEEDLNKLKKMYVAKARYDGNAHMVQEWFNMQGFFAIKVTPLGANLVLLEEMEEGILPALYSDAKEWVDEHFDGIRGWSPYELDKERAVWIRCHGIPVHAWNNEFFSMIAGKFGTFLGVDENTRKKNSMDVALILLRTNWYDVFNMVIHANINGEMFHIKVLEEWWGPMHWEGGSGMH